MDVTIDEIRRLVAAELRRSSVAAADRLVEDLEVDSLEMVGIIAALEESYGIRIEEAELPDLTTVAELYACVRNRVGT